MKEVFRYAIGPLQFIIFLEKYLLLSVVVSIED